MERPDMLRKSKTKITIIPLPSLVNPEERILGVQR